jgi:hypothetical protein
MPRIVHLIAAFTMLVATATAGAAGKAKVDQAGQQAAQTRAEIAVLLNNFLLAENNGKREVHDRFWADDLVYTSSGAVVKTKADILRSFDDTPAAKADAKAEPAGYFAAEDILVRPYGNTAALTFRLVFHAPDGSTENYRNSGTFLRRNGKWQAVTWQATKVPAPAQ